MILLPLASCVPSTSCMNTMSAPTLRTASRSSGRMNFRLKVVNPLCVLTVITVSGGAVAMVMRIAGKPFEVGQIFLLWPGSMQSCRTAGSLGVQGGGAACGTSCIGPSGRDVERRGLLMIASPRDADGPSSAGRDAGISLGRQPADWPAAADNV